MLGLLVGALALHPGRAPPGARRDDAYVAQARAEVLHACVLPLACAAAGTAALIAAAGPAAAAEPGSILAQGPDVLMAQAATLSDVLSQASRRALGGGISGAIAGAAQVVTLMWLRTTMNYQYRYGTSTRDALKSLYKEGGLKRLYAGLPFALLQVPLSRFGDTAANTGMLALLASPEVFGGSLPVPVRTAAASAAAALWRIGLTPLDTVKTTLQVEGGDRGYEQVLGKIKAGGATVLYQARAPTRLASAAGAGTRHPRRDHPGPSAQGALGNALATFVGSYPWYLTFNTLNEAIPLPEGAELATKAAAPRLARPPPPADEGA